MNMHRLDKILSKAGIGSRKEVRQFIKDGLVKMNGLTVKDSSIHINIDKDLIEVKGKPLLYREYIYIMLNKPEGVLSATEDKHCKTVLDLIDKNYSHYKLFPVGRLDKDTEGLILLTNDGTLTHKILSPKNHIPKKYYVKICGKISIKDVDFFKQGVILENGYKTLPSELNILTTDDKSSAELTIYEGKFHQIKRMFESIGKKVLYLKRLNIGNLVLDNNLKLGEYRELNDNEINALYNLLNTKAKGDSNYGCKVH